MAAAQRPEPARTNRPMRADARRNSELLISTAREVFAEKGVEAPMDEIAKRAGVGAGTLYRHFPNRDALIEAVYLTEMRKLAARAEELLAQYPPDQALRIWLRDQANWMNHRRGLSSSLKAALKPNSETMNISRELIFGAAESLLAAGRAAGTVRADIKSYDVVRLAHGLSVATEYSTDDDVDRMLTVITRGLSPDPNAPTT